MTQTTVDPRLTRAESIEDVIDRVYSGARAFVHGACATPMPLLEALSQRSDLEGVLLYHLHTAGAAPFAAPEQAGHLTSVSLFTGPAARRCRGTASRSLRCRRPQPAERFPGSCRR